MRIVPFWARLVRAPGRAWHTARPTLQVLLLLAANSALAAQGADSTRAARERAASERAATDSARRVEGVLVTAIRASGTAPIAEKTVQRAAIRARNFGQDVPLLLQGASPSLLAHTETGTPWGYSYLRLRGVDQTRINITLDGVPLNDMEDQVLYFANFADMMESVQSVQVQRGVGTSSAGTASFAGSINFETLPLAVNDAGGSVELQLGSFNARRASASFQSGLLPSRFAFYGRASALRTDGYREHSGVEGRSAFLGAGWFGDRDVIKLTTLLGLLADTLSYVGATREELAQNRRFNPLAPDERDRFTQQMVALSHTRIASANTSLTTTLYRNSASGHYDYFYLPDRYQFGLAHAWYGLTSAINQRRGNVQLNAGVNANTYERAHRAFLQPDLASPLYDNTGHKDDVSAFAKLAVESGRFRWFGDLQARHARFRYAPDANAGIDGRSVDWTFFNPKAGVTLNLGDGVSAFASYGATTREPGRNDMFAGDDDMNASNVDAIGDLSRVKPERVRDAELGLSVSRAAWQLSANLYSMDFRNDIARIGAPTATGLILRRNVGASYRRGLELDASWRGSSRLTLAGNASWSSNRIRQFTDSSGDSPLTRRNVEPLLTPRFTSTHRAELMVTREVDVSVEGRYQSTAFLDNTSNAQRVLPASYLLDAAARWRRSGYALVVRGTNLGNSERFGSGSVSGSGEVRYFVLPPRSVFVTAEFSF
ncbi:MAG: TonB-dependent receptor [Gemmatimonadaceae bacterium]